MLIEAKKNNLCVNQLLEEKTQTMMIETDCIIPDSKPDILSVMSTNGTVCIYKKEMQEKKVKIEGSIDTYLMYVADTQDGGIRGMNTNIDFSEFIQMEKAKEGFSQDTNVELKTIECKVLNGRKISLRATMEVTIRLYSNENIQIIEDVAQLPDLQVLKEQMEIHSLIGEGMTKAYAKDTVAIENTENLAEIMKSEFSVTNKEMKISYNKVLVKAELMTKILYLTEDGNIKNVTKSIPIMGFVDMPNIEENNLCDSKIEMKNILVKPNNVEEHSVFVEVEVEIQCKVYEEKEVELIQDLYSPIQKLEFTQKKVNLIAKKNWVKDICNIRQKQTIEQIGAREIIDVSMQPVMQKQDVRNGRIAYEGNVEIGILLKNSITQTVEVQTRELPFTFDIQNQNIRENSSIETRLEIKWEEVVVQTDNEIEIKVDVGIEAGIQNRASISIIEDMQVEENRDVAPASMVIYYTKKEDTLWEIAKRFRSTVEEIRKMNQLEEGEQMNCRQLYIPRYVMKNG